MTSEWVVISSICSVPSLTCSLCLSCPSVTVSLQGTRINSSENKQTKTRQKEKGDLLVSMGMSHGIQVEEAAKPQEENQGWSSPGMPPFSQSLPQFLSQCHVYYFS